MKVHLSSHSLSIVVINNHYNKIKHLFKKKKNIIRIPPQISVFTRKFYLKLFSGAKGFPGGSNGKVSAHNVGDLGLIPGSGRSPGEGNGNPLQYSCLENSMDGGALWANSPWGSKESETTEWLHFTSLQVLKRHLTLNLVLKCMNVFRKYTNCYII